MHISIVKKLILSLQYSDRGIMMDAFVTTQELIGK